jgi:hypothetical protein
MDLIPFFDPFPHAKEMESPIFFRTHATDKGNLGLPPKSERMSKH